jgi:manganese/zinc/iron transport system permease protein
MSSTTSIVAGLWSAMGEFWSLRDPNVVWVLTGAVLLGAATAIVGCFGFLRKQSLVGDALAHAALPGVTTAFLLFQSRSPAVILAGAAVSCILGILVIDYLTASTKIKRDSALALVLSFFFAIGVFQLSIIQRNPLASQAGLDRLLFGQAASLVRSDVQILIAVTIAIIFTVILFFPKLKLVTFDRTFAKASGVNVRAYELLISALVIVAVVVGLQLVGVVLLAALLLTPAAAARYWSDDLRVMIFLAALFGALSGVVGANVSYLAPRMPTGPWMVVAVTVCFAVSLLFAPQRGVLARLRRQLIIRRTVTDENILRTLFKLGENGSPLAQVSSAAILTHRNYTFKELQQGIKRLAAAKLVHTEGDKLNFTAAGLKRGAELTRAHRLWERYLTDVVDIAPDHVHADAEEIEHVLTPDLQERIEQELQKTGRDPHGAKIPQQTKEEVNE